MTSGKMREQELARQVSQRPSSIELRTNTNARELRKELNRIIGSFEGEHIPITGIEAVWAYGPERLYDLRAIREKVIGAARSLFKPNWVEDLTMGRFSSVAEKSSKLVIPTRMSFTLPTFVSPHTPIKMQNSSFIIVTDHQSVEIMPNSKTFDFSLGGDNTEAEVKQANLIARALTGIKYRETTPT